MLPALRRSKRPRGFYNGTEIYHVSFEVSDPDLVPLEGGTFAPALNAAPGIGSNDPKTSARSKIVPFVNGQTGIDNPDRRGLNSALLGQAAMAAGARTRQMKFDDIRELADQGYITGPAGAFGPGGFIVN